ncbi:hypothetical protein QBC45DRAFT_470553 [Copromyces sp. CBS 386.78]|nr:hypothetical protein QBC45DRAFT_470553 [Copromyces sp. CBS 386.78]
MTEHLGSVLFDSRKERGEFGNTSGDWRLPNLTARASIIFVAILNNLLITVVQLRLDSGDDTRKALRIILCLVRCTLWISGYFYRQDSTYMMQSVSKSLPVPCGAVRSD